MDAPHCYCAVEYLLFSLPFWRLHLLYAHDIGFIPFPVPHSWGWSAQGGLFHVRFYAPTLEATCPDSYTPHIPLFPRR